MISWFPLIVINGTPNTSTDAGSLHPFKRSIGAMPVFRKGDWNRNGLMFYSSTLTRNTDDADTAGDALEYFEACSCISPNTWYYGPDLSNNVPWPYMITACFPTRRYDQSQMNASHFYPWRNESNTSYSEI
jgi:hypothetical protein